MQMQSYDFLYVYSNGTLVRCLDLDEELKKGKDLRDLGWMHTCTLNPKLWMARIAETNNEERLAMADELKTGKRL